MKKLITLLILSFLLAPFASAETIIVQRGDTLSKLARTYGTTVAALADANGIANPNLIYEGQLLEVGALGASIPTVVAVYTDSLASRITSSATTFTLVRGTDKQSRSLSGFYGFVLDEGTTSEEFLTANCVATACTIVARGVDVQDGKSEVSGNKYEHRRGAVIKITNFPQLAILSRILNGLESASSTFMFGEGSTTTTLYKYLKANNGTTNLPFLAYSEAAQEWIFSDNGTDTTVLNSLTSGGLTASSSKAIFITDSKIGVSASSTQFSFNADGELESTPYWYQDATFKGAITANGTNTFTGNTTTTGIFTVNTPTSTRDATNKEYVDLRVLNGGATGTAGFAITAGQAIYISSTSTLFPADSASGATSTYKFVGIALNTAASSSVVTYARPGETACSLSSLLPGYTYFLTDTAGTVGSTAGTYYAEIGRAITPTCLTISRPRFVRYGSQSVSSVTTYFQTTGFYPAKISFWATEGAAVSHGGKENNTSFYETAAGATTFKSDRAWYTADGAPGSITQGTVSSRIETGFVLTASQADQTATVYWMAEN